MEKLPTSFPFAKMKVRGQIGVLQSGEKLESSQNPGGVKSQRQSICTTFLVAVLAGTKGYCSKWSVSKLTHIKAR